MQPVEVNLHGYRRARCSWSLRRLFSLIHRRACIRGGPWNCAPTGSASAAPAREAWRTAHTFVLVALRKKRARLTFLQHRKIQREVLVVVIRRHVEPLGSQPEVCRRKEPQILSTRVPRRPHRVGKPIGDLLRLAGLHVAYKYRVIH